MSADSISLENQDAGQVDEALRALHTGDVESCRALLADVARRTPDDYANEFEQDGKLHIRFWDQPAFLHYVLWNRDRAGCDREVVWLGNAYPRAWFYLGFLQVKERMYENAIDLLDAGRRLEPQNPKFLLEKGPALVGLRRLDEALELYTSVNTLGPYVSALNLAMAARGRGCVLIEMGRLKEARAAFEHSLTLEPGNQVALHELLYIESLNRGARASSYDLTEVTGKNTNVCARCGETFLTLTLVSHAGKTSLVCDTCNAQPRKVWWRFWN